MRFEPARPALFSFLPVVLAVLCSALSPADSLAAGPKEFYLNSAGLELFGGANRISLSPGLNYGFFEWLQAGGSVGYQSVGFGDDSVNTLTVLAGPTFDLGGPYSNATFLFFGFAYRKGSGTVSDPTSDPGGTGLAFMVGRRVPLSSKFQYRPSVGIQLAGRTTLVVNALAVSYLF